MNTPDSDSRIGDPEWVDATMIVVTDQIIESRYGRQRIGVQLLRNIADHLNRDSGPMVFQHDPSQPIRTRNRRAVVERSSDDTYWVVKLDAQVHREDWDAMHASFAAAGAPGGMSISLTEPIREPATDSGLHVIGDAADFTDEDLIALTDGAPDPAAVGVWRLYQFSPAPELPVRLILELTAAVLYGVPANMLADWLMRIIDTLRGRASRLNRPPTLEIHYRKSADGEVEVLPRAWLNDDEQAAVVADRFAKMIERIDAGNDN